MVLVVMLDLIRIVCQHLPRIRCSMDLPHRTPLHNYFALILEFVPQHIAFILIARLVQLVS